MNLIAKPVRDRNLLYSNCAEGTDPLLILRGHVEGRCRVNGNQGVMTYTVYRWYREMVTVTALLMIPRR